jgi:hypothetical protein
MRIVLSLFGKVGVGKKIGLEVPFAGQTYPSGHLGQFEPSQEYPPQCQPDELVYFPGLHGTHSVLGPFRI